MYIVQLYVLRRVRYMSYNHWYSDTFIGARLRVSWVSSLPCVQFPGHHPSFVLALIFLVRITRGVNMCICAPMMIGKCKCKQITDLNRSSWLGQDEGCTVDKSAHFIIILLFIFASDLPNSTKISTNSETSHSIQCTAPSCQLSPIPSPSLPSFLCAGPFKSVPMLCTVHTCSLSFTRSNPCSGLFWGRLSGLV